MKPKALLFLDFDGVICDSALECFSSSLEAFSRVNPDRADRSKNISADERKERFLLMRPYIRNSEDYLFIHEIITADLEIRSQVEFDDYMSSSNAELKKKYRKAFFEVRYELYNGDRKSWLDSNPLYPHMKDLLSAYSKNPGLCILSTKKVDFIMAILAHNNIAIEKQNVIYSAENERKLDHIGRILASGQYGRAVFVDDQVDHFKGNTDPRIETYLPLWGYIEKNCFEHGDDISIINESEMAGLFAILDS
jgi:phosphoglycolate phosphatase-like HAD superfamily hydrolase